MTDSTPEILVNTAAGVSEQVESTKSTDTRAVNKTKADANVKTKMSRAALQKTRARKAVSAAKKQVGDPYRWGASGPGAFDCSGLVKYAWRKAGVSIPRITHSQYRAIRKKVSWSRLRPGDLMFFSGKGHVGMYVGEGRMVHSPSSGKTVRIVKLKGYYRSSFAGAVRPGA
ncbi:C40 family peptidase [Streptosporangium sp. NBC_01755]|uniref:C40 family peptidase n=1 Tax=unclassified Streptosporangium TaxID=2632669 RepID=UPI002DDBD0D5|nr:MULTISPECIES: C40 family peptidase [unclassified Streptosporangium]WSA22969.1 C40 family peptidase [Streptosporangium sp. NBC_01810]WSC98888.1 C40 family peptidase [Streptosporangium sp. NBC_01755]